MNCHILAYKVAIAIVFFFSISLFAEEGMYPLSEIENIGLEEKGLEINVNEIFNPDTLSLVDAIVKLGGCTGSFVSEDGLILTNHHCAFGALQANSSEDNDLITNGFAAFSRSEEVPAPGYTVRITENYWDVSEEVLSVVNDSLDYTERTKAIEKRIKEIEKETEEKYEGMRAEVAEMFVGKTYVLFLYTYLKDVRLVYSPPLSIGNYGGEIDNWMWPRHTGDFSFMRAYVGKDGNPASYSEDNVPYRPKKYFRIAKNGCSENDFVFILGYPGRTYKHYTSHYLTFEKEVRLPYYIQFYDWLIEVMEREMENDPAATIKLAQKVKSRSNATKNYKGKIQGLYRVPIIERKREEEQKLQAFINSDLEMQEKYGDLLSEIDRYYLERYETAEYDFLLSFLANYCDMVSLAVKAYEASIELEKEDIDRKPQYMERNWDRMEEAYKRAYKNFHEETDKIILKELLIRATNLPESQMIPAIRKLSKKVNTEKNIDKFIERAYRKTKLKDREFFEGLLLLSPEEIEKISDPFIKFAVNLYPTLRDQEQISKERKGRLDQLYAQLIDVKKEFLKTEFIPDANGTLRLTYGYVEGYSPADALYCYPFTTVGGIIEKATGEMPFAPPERIFKLYEMKDYGEFASPELGSVPVCILYSMDTTGGNSGSPVLNAYGELVGLNFDRVFEATINDFAWDQSYSRSIGVDARYILWILQKYAGMDNLLNEMKVGIKG